MARARLTRAVEFPAGHRYVLPGQTEEDARRRFGPSARPHGHRWRCEVTVAGEIDEETGMVVDLGALDRVLEERIREPMDHAFLNRLPEFEDGGLPTTEAIARVVWDRLRGGLPDACELVVVRVREDGDLWAEYRGG